MKQIEFPPGTRPGTKERVNAILWAAYRQGTRTFESSSGNVRGHLTNYLNEQGANWTDIEVSGAIKWLVEKGYASKDTHERKTYKFTINEDVNLKVAPPTFVTQQTLAYTNGTASTVEDIPLPGTPEPVEVYRLEELISLLGEWHDVDREAYAQWVDKVIPRLQKETSSS